MDAIASREKYRQYVRPEAGLVSRRIFHDEEIYRAELDRIFKRAWLYLAHESEVPDSGDFVHVYMGEEAVILCRDRDGQLYGLVNSCRHRGNRVCRVDRGNARSFVCSYHGWAYNTKGNLIGVPGKTELYKDDIDQPSLGLVRVARIDSYKGLVFGTFDPEAPSLEEFLGDMRWGWTCCWTRAIWSRRRAWCAGISRATGSSPPTTRSAICTTPPGLIARPCWRGIWAAMAPSRWRSMRRRASRRASPCWRPMGTGSTPTSPRPMRWTWARRWRPGGSIPPSRRGSGRCVPGCSART